MDSGEVGGVEAPECECERSDSVYALMLESESESPSKSPSESPPQSPTQSPTQSPSQPVPEPVSEPDTGSGPGSEPKPGKIKKVAAYLIRKWKWVLGIIVTILLAMFGTFLTFFNNDDVPKALTQQTPIQEPFTEHPVMPNVSVSNLPSTNTFTSPPMTSTVDPNDGYANTMIVIVSGLIIFFVIAILFYLLRHQRRKRKHGAKKYRQNNRTVVNTVNKKTSASRVSLWVPVN